MAKKQNVFTKQGPPLTQLDGGQMGWSVNEFVLTSASRFAQFQQTVIASSEPSLALLAARMVAFDGVPPKALTLLQE